MSMRSGAEGIFSFFGHQDWHICCFYVNISYQAFHLNLCNCSKQADSQNFRWLRWLHFYVCLLFISACLCFTVSTRYILLVRPYLLCLLNHIKNWISFLACLQLQGLWLAVCVCANPQVILSPMASHLLIHCCFFGFFWHSLSSVPAFSFTSHLLNLSIPPSFIYLIKYIFHCMSLVSLAVVVGQCNVC